MSDYQKSFIGAFMHALTDSIDNEKLELYLSITKFYGTIGVTLTKNSIREQ